jgi:anti-repressor protein
MTNALATFNFNSNAIRVVTIEDQPWFFASEVCAVLGYYDGRKAVLDHVEESQRNTVSIRDGNRGNPNKAIINEGGLYSLIMASKLPAAREFKLWVTDIVLPAIRKDGMYVAGEEKVSTGEMSDEELTLLVMERLRSKIDRIKEENVKLTTENTAMGEVIGKHDHTLARFVWNKPSCRWKRP